MAADSQMSPIGDADKTVALQHPPPRHLGCNAAIDRLSADNIMDDGVNRVPARQEGVLVAAHRLADIEVDIAVTDMPERQDARPRHEALDGRHRIRQQRFHHRVDADVFVDTNGLIYATDFNAGLYVMEYTS